MNAGGVLNTCKSNEALYLIFFGNEDFVDVYKRQLPDSDVTIETDASFKTVISCISVLHSIRHTPSE